MQEYRLLEGILHVVDVPAYRLVQEEDKRNAFSRVIHLPMATSTCAETSTALYKIRRRAR